jgi:DNA replication protein DnaD
MTYFDNSDERRADLIQKYLNRTLNASEQIELEELAEQDPSVGKAISALQRARNAQLTDKILKEQKVIDALFRSFLKKFKRR